MSVLPSVERLVYSFLWVGNVTVKGFQEKNPKASCVISLYSLCCHFTSAHHFLNLTLIEPYFSYSFHHRPTSVSDLWFQTYEHIRGNDSDQTFDRLMLSSLLLSYSPSGFFFKFLYICSTPGHATNCLRDSTKRDECIL